MMYRSTKHYGHDNGFSTCFRQHKAQSHCALLHGYALAFTFVFEAEELDERGWVIDFGGLKVLKDMLTKMFDHTLIVSEDDPQIGMLALLASADLANVIILQRVGCEAFAALAYELAQRAVMSMGQSERVRVVSCTVAEHGANSAVYIPARKELPR